MAKYAVGVYWWPLCWEGAYAVRNLDNQNPRVNPGSIKIKLLAIADTPDQHERGFQFVRHVSPMSGILFRFAHPKVLNFWMANTYVGLDIVFVDQKGFVVKMERMIPLSLRTVSSGRPCTMALEVPAGTLERAGVKVGDRMRLEGDEVVIGDAPC